MTCWLQQTSGQSTKAFLIFRTSPSCCCLIWPFKLLSTLFKLPLPSHLNNHLSDVCISCTIYSVLHIEISYEIWLLHNLHHVLWLLYLRLIDLAVCMPLLHQLGPTSSNHKSCPRCCCCRSPRDHRCLCLPAAWVPHSYRWGQHMPLQLDQTFCHSHGFLVDWPGNRWGETRFLYTELRPIELHHQSLWESRLSMQQQLLRNRNQLIRRCIGTKGVSTWAKLSAPVHS